MKDTPFTQDYRDLVAGSIPATVDIDLLTVTGNDRLQVINNLCTADIKKLEPREGTESFITDVRGRCVGHMCIFHGDQEIVLIGHTGQAERLVSHIDRYVIREDVQIESSPNTRGFLWSGRTKPCSVAGFSPLEQYRLATGIGHVSGLAMRWFQIPWTSKNDCLFVSRDDDAEALQSWQSSHRFSGAAALETARIEAFWPLYGTDFSDANLPQEICRNAQAISFTKGCYLGQETVARLDALGQVQKKLVPLTIESDVLPPVGTELICEETVCGEIRSSSWSHDASHVMALGFVKRKWLSGSNRFSLADQSGWATIADLNARDSSSLEGQ